MRVITGTARGIGLRAPEGLLTRPTADRVKQAIFNIIQYDIAGDVLDLFAGSGQMGIEALSRGAREGVFCDARADALKVVRENLRHTGLENRAQLLQGDYLSCLERLRNRRFRLIFLDPPYGEKYLETAIKRLAEIDILAEGGIIIGERPLGKPLDMNLPGFSRSKDYNYGKTTVALFRKETEDL